VVGYVDHAGTLPFKLFEMYWLSRLDLASTLDLVAVDPAAQPPGGLSTLIANGAPPGGETRRSNRGAATVLSVDFRPPFMFDHYRPRRVPLGDVETMQRVGRYLDSHLDLDALLRVSAAPDIPCGATPRLEWNDDRQGFRIEGMQPGRLVRINYTYFPYWHADHGALFRGSAERMYYEPSSSTASFSYTRNRSFATWLGIGLSLAATAVLAVHHALRFGCSFFSILVFSAPWRFVFSDRG
jgi:hypothetical protein